jgi:hypothetical protein
MLNSGEESLTVDFFEFFSGMDNSGFSISSGFRRKYDFFTEIDIYIF